LKTTFCIIYYFEIVLLARLDKSLNHLKFIKLIDKSL
jgi:hypothetical protein